MDATLSSDVSKDMPLSCFDKLNYFRLFKYQRGTLAAVTKRNLRNVWLLMFLLKTGRNLASSFS